MKNAKKSFRKTEKTTAIAGLILAIIFLILRPLLGYYEYEGLIGYILGLVSTITFVEGFFLIENKPRPYTIGFIIFLNIKLVILAGLIYLLHKAGVSAIHTIIGMLTSHTLATVTLLVTLHRDHCLKDVGPISEDQEKETNDKANI